METLQNKTVKINPDDYPFKKFIDEQKHLDTDESRHLIQSIVHIIDRDLKGQEYRFCDKNHPYQKHPKLEEMERRKFKTLSEMDEADKKAEEDAQRRASLEKKAKEDARDKELAELKALVQQLLAKK
jgi:hypothetical protein